MHTKTVLRENVTWADCISFSDVFLDSFRTDHFFGLVWPKKYMFTDYEELKTTASSERKADFQRLLNASARKYYLEILTGRSAISTLYDDKNRPVAVTFWRLPAQSPLVAHLTAWERLHLLFRKYYYKALDYFAFFWSDGGRNPFKSPKMGEIMGTRDELSGLLTTPERLKTLASMSRKELAEAIYPSSYAYYLSIMAVRNSEQRKGYAKKVVMVFIENTIPKVPTKFEYNGIESSGPSKVGLFSSPPAKEFYPRLGFAPGSNSSVTLKDGTIFTHDHFQMTVPGT